MRKRNGGRRGAEDRAPRNAKSLMGFQAMLPNGIAVLGGDWYSATVRLGDISYQIATQEQQEDIIDRWGRFLNSLADGMRLEITVSTRTVTPETVSRRITMKPTGGRYDGLREDFNNNVERMLAGSTTSSVTDRYLTFSVHDTDQAHAVTTLNRACVTAASRLRSVDGCTAVKLDRTERLRVLHATLRPGMRFTFDEGAFAHAHTQTLDYVTPWAVVVKDPRRLGLQSGDSSVWRTTLWVSDFPDYLTDQLVAGLTDMTADVTVSVHLAPKAKAEGMRLVNTRIAEMEMQAADERGKNERRHQPEDWLPHDLEESMDEASELRDDLRHNGERLVDSVIVVGVSAPDRDRLDQVVHDVRAVVDAQSCVAENLTYMQVEGLQACLPLGVDRLPMNRTLTTSGAAILVPFTSQELIEDGGVFYGRNTQSTNPVAVDRTRGINGNGFILGTSGSGKSQAAKNEMTQLFLTRPDDELIVIDPEREFTPLCLALGGERVEIGESSPQHLNAMDIEFGDGSGEDPVKAKCGAVLSMLDALIGGQDGMDRVERSLVDRCCMRLYQELRDGERTVMPTLADLQSMLAGLPEREARRTAAALEIYTRGSLDAFSHRTDVDVHNRMVVYDVMGLGNELRTFGMMVVLDQIWLRVVRNRARGVRTWLWVDEFHMLFSNPFAADYFLRLYKRARKWGLAVTGITQNIEELLLNDSARLMLSNSDFLLLMNQNATDADTLCRTLKLSDEQREYFVGVEPGQGMLKSGTAYIPFDGRINTGSRLYRLYSTTFGEDADARS